MRLISRLLLWFLLLPVAISAQRHLTQYVDPFIGTGGHGHTFPGATLPFGMVQLSPDTRLSGWDGCSGYHYSDHIIYGFSHTHLSGSGISDYGDILLMPMSDQPSLDALVDGQTDKGYASPFNHRNEKASPGYYSVILDDGDIKAELTSTNRVGFHRYTYPKDSRPNIILDLSHRDTVLDSFLRIIDSSHVEGYRRSSGWAKDQIVYFVAEFSQPFGFEIALDGRLDQKLKEGRGKSIKAVFSFPSSRQPILVKVAISSVSVAGARRNLASELPGWNFERVVQRAETSWNHELNRLEINGGTEDQLKTFYTALYHTMIAPNLFMDVDGEFRGRDLKTHTASGFTNYSVFSLWDTFRAAHPLYTIIEQKRTADFINTFLAQYDFGGRLPVWELAGNETDTMIGYHAVPVITDAAIKGISGFDREIFMVKARDVSAQNSYIQSATLNGQPYRHSYLLHKDLMNGGELVFQMGSQPSFVWGSSINDIPTSHISAARIVPVPVIVAPAKTFKDKMEVVITARSREQRLHFTTDESEPDANSEVFERPFMIRKTTTVKAIAVGSNGARSLVASAVFQKIPHEWVISIASRYSSQYAAGGDLAVIDGIRGNRNFSTGSWQGYQGQDFEAVIDLGKVQELRKLGAGFLQDIGSWIWMPRRVEFELSIDGQSYTTASAIANEVSDKEFAVVVRDFVRTIPTQRARYVRIKAINYGKIPEWHSGNGGEAWIFVDEIEIQ
jgi:hypothetical protein